MATYQDIRRQIENLASDEKLQLLEELAARHRMQLKPKRSIMELKRLGKELWQGLDTQAYINRERASWKS